MQIQVEIDVDLSFPEHNREVFVFVFSGKKHQGKLHDGISIELVADVRDVTKGLYKAFILPNRPDVFIQFPAQSASFALDHRLVSEKEGTNLCDKVKEARDITRNAIQNSEVPRVHVPFKYNILSKIQRRQDQADQCSIQTPYHDWPDPIFFIAMSDFLEDSYC